MASRLYLAFCGSSVWIIEGHNLSDARTRALENVNSEADIRGLFPLAADEIRVRPARDGEVESLVG